MVHTGVKILSWAVAVFDDRCHDGRETAKQLKNCCCRQGLTMPDPAMVMKEIPNNQNLPPEQRVKAMMDQLGSYNPQFILAILPVNASNSDLYGLNSPLSPKGLVCLAQTTIIFGMDVSHGSIGEDVPSIVAVVASKNWPNVFHYASRARAQPTKMEMIEGLCTETKGGMIKELLMEFYSSYAKGFNRKPTQIIVYKGGISERQFAECVEKEAIAFKRARKDMGDGYEKHVNLIFIVAQKRHNTRFFPWDQAMKTWKRYARHCCQQRYLSST